MAEFRQSYEAWGMTYDHDRQLFAADLYGRSMISYMRFSSSQQGSGSTLERQAETRDRVQTYYRLVQDEALLDQARSASKGHHRTKGELGGLLEAIKRGEIDFAGKVLSSKRWTG